MLQDPFKRKINYLRLSVTDRCDFRCQYCMSEDIEFMPKNQMLTIEEMNRLANIFINLGVEKIRLTGGEPLVRRGVNELIDKLSHNKKLKELTLTTNGSQLDQKLDVLKQSKIKRINVSLDSLCSENFKKITRIGNLNEVLANLEVAKEYFQIKLNTVLMKNINDHEIIDLVSYAVEQNFNISFIEQMPLGEIGYDRSTSFINSIEAKKIIEKKYILEENNKTTGGPAVYWKIKGSNSFVGFISPHSHNFCDSCNRVRVSADGYLHLCLGHDEKVNLIEPLRAHDSDDAVAKLIVDSLSGKPKSHEFNLENKTNVIRFMSHTGG
jgi:cyclic pyranopterin phosphate synthase